MKIKLFLQIIISLLSLLLVPFRVRRQESRIFYLSFLFLLTFNYSAFAEEKIPVFPTGPVEVYTIYTSLAVFWLAIIGLIVVIKMKLNDIERIQKLGIDKEDTHAPLLE